MPRTLTDDIFFDPEYTSEYTDDELAYMRDRLTKRIDAQFSPRSINIMREKVVIPIEAEIARREAKKREQE